MKQDEVVEPVWAEYRSACAGSLLPVSANRSGPSLHHRLIFQLTNSAAASINPELRPPPPSERRLISRPVLSSVRCVLASS